jgi:putative transcriptional regulator
MIAMPSLTLNFSHHLLVAMPAMTDSVFSKSVIYVCEHNEQGALGIIVNRPISLTLDDLFAQIKVTLADTEIKSLPVHFGGPVQTDRGFILHDPVGQWQSTLTINDNLGLTTSKDILEAVAAGKGPRNILVTLGYTGWAQGQLEQEMADNAWLSIPAAEHILFDLPAEERLSTTMGLLGIDYASLSEDAGHA